MISSRSEVPLYSISEWKSCEIEGVVLSPEDRHLIASLGAEQEGGKVRIDEFGDRLRVTAHSWVGAIRFSGFEVRIIPKLTGGNLGLVELMDYALELNHLRRYEGYRKIKEQDDNLFDVLALLLAEACDRLLRRGELVADYRELEDELPVVRGRLLVDRQVLRHFGEIDRLECRHDEQVTDISENQILAAALMVAGRRAKNPQVQQKVRRLLAIFLSICQPEEEDLQQARQDLIYDRKNEAYRESHVLAWIILDAMGIGDLFSSGMPRCFSFLLDMNALFERFLYRWMSQVLSGSDFLVEAQRRDRSILWNASQNRPYRSIIPDLLIKHRTGTERRLPLDAKYKLYDETKLGMGDIYQTFLYAFAYGTRKSRHTPAALLIFPASINNVTEVRLHVRNTWQEIGAEILALNIHIPTALAEAKQNHDNALGKEMLAVIQTYFPN